MRVRALKSFAAMVAGEMQVWHVDQQGELPEGADWLQTGFVAEVAPAPELAPDEGLPEEESSVDVDVDPVEPKSKPGKGKRGK